MNDPPYVIIPMYMYRLQMGSLMNASPMMFHGINSDLLITIFCDKILERAANTKSCNEG